MNFLDERLPPKFWHKLIPEPNSGCWLWLGAIQTGGYGQMLIPQYLAGSGISAGRRVCVHRFTYESLVGAIPLGLQLDHLCRQRSCANPDHLEPVTQTENVRRGLVAIVAARRQLVKTHCPQGHAYDAANTYVYRGQRRCLRCSKARQAIHGARYSRAYSDRKRRAA